MCVPLLRVFADSQEHDSLHFPEELGAAQNRRVRRGVNASKSELVAVMEPRKDVTEGGKHGLG